jgi:hypothetical protein
LDTPPERVILLVLDSVGVGELPDARTYSDEGSDTLGNIARQVPLAIPTLRALGIERVSSIPREATTGSPIGAFGRMAEQSPGKDSVTGHWELMGLVMDRPCVTGRVPFAGNNGPSILLEILTKEPKPPSEVGKDQKFPVPPTLDPVMAQAFKKLAALRIPSVGALADAVAGAYGLEGGHAHWAAVPEGEIAARITEKLPALMAVRPQAKTDAADSFFGEMGALEAPGGAALPNAAVAAVHAPVPSARNTADLVAAGIPKAGPNWLVLLSVGGGALFLGIVIVVLLLAR